MSGQVDYDRESGRCAYEAYHRALRSQSRPEDVQPDWEGLPKDIQEHWIAVARAVRQHQQERVTQF